MSSQSIIDKQIDELNKRFGEESQMCECGHHKEFHYWNGGGRIENSGYDSCRAEGCKCVYDEEKIILEPIVNINLEAFLRTSMLLMEKSVKEEIITNLTVIRDDSLNRFKRSKAGTNEYLLVRSTILTKIIERIGGTAL
jgi:hypothetical protein